MEQSKLYILCFQIKIFHKECEIKPKVLNYSFWEDPFYEVSILQMQQVNCLKHFAFRERLHN